MNRNLKIILYLFLICVAGVNQISAQSTPFQKLYFFSPYAQGSNKFIHTNFYGMEALSDGGFATLGFVTDTNNISEGFLARYDCLGNILWTKLLGISGSPTNTVMGIAETDNSDLVFTFPLATGFFQASTLIGRVDKDGKTRWMKRIGNNTEFGRDIVRTRDGGFVIAGSTGFYGTDTGADDVYLVKIDSLGTIEWSKTYGNPGSTFDEAFAISTDSKNNLVVTGRCIADGTFQAFILKADSLGNPLKFKTYGYNNQRTYSFALLVDPNDNYLITGSTTILEENHQSSEYDVFLIKTDSELNTLFTNIYEVSVGGDVGSIGEGLTISPDGKYVIGVSTFAFTTHNATGPNAPNKNALYVINPDGSIHKAMIYNRKGSQYTRVQRTMEGFYVCAFSTAYANNVNFQGLIIKTDKEYISGCNDIDVTQELSLVPETWTIDDFKYQTKTGHRAVNYTIEKDTNLLFNVLCETKIELNPDIDGPTMACVGDKVTIKDMSTGTDGAKHIWLINGQPAGEGKMDLEITITQPGTYVITKIMSYACIAKQEILTIEVPLRASVINQSICSGTSYSFFNKDYNQSGRYIQTIDLAPCDSLVILSLTVNPPDTIDEIQTICMGSEFEFKGKKYKESNIYIIPINNPGKCDTIYKLNLTVLPCADCFQFPNVVTPNDPMVNNTFKPVDRIPCEARIEDLDFRIYNRWGALVFESNDPNKISWNCQYKDQPVPSDTYSYYIKYALNFNGYLPPPFLHKGMFTVVR